MMWLLEHARVFPQLLATLGAAVRSVTYNTPSLSFLFYLSQPVLVQW